MFALTAVDMSVEAMNAVGTARVITAAEVTMTEVWNHSVIVFAEASMTTVTAGMGTIDKILTLSIHAIGITV